MVELQIGEHQYRVDKLDTFASFHVSRKLAPFIPTLIPLFSKASQLGEASLSEMAGMADSAMPFAECLSGMTEEDSEYVIKKCLSVVMVKHGDTWASVQRDGVLMFSFIDMLTMMRLVVAVIKDNLAAFMPALVTAAGAIEAAKA